MRYLKQSTSVDVPIGPFLDATDGVTAETALTLTQPDIRLKKNGGAWAQKAAAQTLSHEENGYYEVTLDATDTDTLGLLRLAVNESGALPVFEDFMVLAANVYDALVAASDYLHVGLREVESTVTTPAAAVPALGLIATGTTSGTHSTTTADLGTNAPSYDISGATLLIAGRPPRVVDSYNTGTGVATFSPAMATAPVDALAWALLGSAPASTAVYAGVDVINWKGATAPAMTGDAFARLGAPAGASIAADLLAIDNLVDDLETRLTAARAGYLDNLSAGAVAQASALSTVAGYVDTEVAAILAIANKIDTALELDGAVYRFTVNALELAPTGGSAPTAAAIRAEIDANSTQLAALVTAVDAVPTNAELATALGTANDAVLAAIAALNNLSQANIRTALGMASANLDTQLAAIDDAVDTEIAAIVTNVGTLLTNVASILAAVDTEVAAIKAKTDLLPAAPAATGDIPTAMQVADALLGRNIAGGSSTGRTVTSALRRLRNKVAIAAGTMTVYQEDDTTSDHTAAVTTAAGNPITSIDPA